MVTRFNVVDQEVGGTVGGVERENGGGDNRECEGGREDGESWGEGGIKCSAKAGGSTSSSSSNSENSSSLPSIMGSP